MSRTLDTSHTIPGYEFVEKLGEGSKGAVWRAIQLSLDRPVAIKLLPGLQVDAEQTRGLVREARAAARLNHPHIVQAYDVGQTPEFHYFVMEYVAGPDVHQLINRRGWFTEAETLDIAIQIAEALRHIHQRGMVHCDVKPHNILIGPDGKAKLADLGLARAAAVVRLQQSDSRSPFGTPFYNAPEQIRGQRVGPASDLYSFGATLYHMLTGQPPYPGQSIAEVCRRHLHDPITPPDHLKPELSAGISEIVEVLLSKDPDERYHNVGDLLTDLRSVQAGRPPSYARQSAGSFARLAELEQTAAAPVRRLSERERLRYLLAASLSANVGLIVWIILLHLTRS